jgi:hypothetical protein
MATFYCLRFETPPTWRLRSPYLYPPGTGWPGYTSRHWVPFLSPPTHRAMVEVFDPASIWDYNCQLVLCLLYNLSTDYTENTASMNSSIEWCVKRAVA